MASRCEWCSVVTAKDEALPANDEASWLRRMKRCRRSRAEASRSELKRRDWNWSVAGDRELKRHDRNWSVAIGTEASPVRAERSPASESLRLEASWSIAGVWSIAIACWSVAGVWGEASPASEVKRRDLWQRCDDGVAIDDLWQRCDDNMLGFGRGWLDFFWDEEGNGVIYGKVINGIGK